MVNDLKDLSSIRYKKMLCFLIHPLIYSNQKNCTQLCLIILFQVHAFCVGVHGAERQESPHIHTGLVGLTPAGISAGNQLVE